MMCLLRHEQQHLTEELLEAMSMVRCPYYRKEETCHMDCYTEPTCITDAPSEGWEAKITNLREKLRKGCHREETK